MRLWMFRLIWLIVWPLRVYLCRSPIARGKGFMTQRLLLPLLPPPPAAFLATLPGGGKVFLWYREVVGISTLLHGSFESAEVKVLREFALPQTTVVDIGANVGVFTVPLALAVGPQGRVLAFEPLHQNVQRLRSNVAMNDLSNVNIFPVALAETDGEIDLKLSDDPAYPSTIEVVQARATGDVIRVPARRLDDVWRESGSPRVTAMKIDVEGGELAVLRGSEELLAMSRPVLVIEANSSKTLEALCEWLSIHGYSLSDSKDFMPWNHLFKAHGQPY